MDEADAIIRAREFCEAIGQGTELKAEAVYSSDPTDMSRDTRYYRPVWTVKFYKSGVVYQTVAISAENGMVCGYTNDRLYLWSYLETSNDQDPVGILLTEDEAKEKASFYRHHAGLTEDLKFAEAILVRTNDGDKKGDNYWIIYYDRVAFDIPYQDQGLNISLAPETGQLQGFGLNFTSAAATSFNRHLSKNQALALAAVYLPKFAGNQIHRANLVHFALSEKTPALAWRIDYNVRHHNRGMRLLINARTGWIIMEWLPDLLMISPYLTGSIIGRTYGKRKR